MELLTILFFLEILLLVLGFILCSSSTGMKTLQYFEVVFGFGTQGM